MPARKGDAELLKPKRGASLLDTMWADLIACIDMLMQPDDYYDDDDGWDRVRMEGRAEGVAWCIAVLTQSPRPIDINIIKVEAMDRWREAQE